MLAIEHGDDLLCEIFVSEVHEDLVNLFIAVLLIALEDDQLINLHVFDICRHTAGLTSQEVEEFTDILLVNEFLALAKGDVLFVVHTLIVSGSNSLILTLIASLARAYS